MSQSTKRRWNSGPSTPSSTSKKKKYNCKFQDEWIFFLSKLAKACCVISVSIADPDRICSMLKKIQTDMRSDLNNDTICCLICAKQN